MIKLKESFGITTQQDILSFEKLMGVTLPTDYKGFLLENNGGRPNPNIFKTINKEFETDIQFFFGITEGIYSIKDNYTQFIKRNNEEFLPIAIDSGGNLVLLEIKSNNIFYLDKDTEDKFFISDNFSDFISNLYKLEISENDFDRAIRTQDIDYFKNRIENGVSINEIRNEFNQSLVIVASLFNKLKVLKFAIENGANVTGALFNASGNGHVNIVSYLLSLDQINPNERDSSQNNDTALIQASSGGYLEIVKILIKNGADIKATDDFGQTALNKSYWSENQELIDYMESMQSL
nr:ankyrin repeat domain-containing protein [Gaetbulibacter sp. 4G1]